MLAIAGSFAILNQFDAKVNPQIYQYGFQHELHMATKRLQCLGRAAGFAIEHSVCLAHVPIESK